MKDYYIILRFVVSLMTLLSKQNLGIFLCDLEHAKQRRRGFKASSDIMW